MIKIKKENMKRKSEIKKDKERKHEREDSRNKKLCVEK